MGLLSRITFAHSALATETQALEQVPVEDKGRRFSVNVDSFISGNAYMTQPPLAPKISRKLALQVPAVSQASALICGTLGSLPIELIGPNNTPVPSPLLEQPERNLSPNNTMTRTYEDLLFTGRAYWRVREFGWHGYPVSVIRLDPDSVNIKSDGVVTITRAGTYGQYVETVNDSEIIVFESPSGKGVLETGARAIRTALLLDAAAARYSEGAPPLDYFTPAEGADPADDEEIIDMLTGWATARQTRSTGYVPAALEYHSGGFSPEQLQMADARQHATLEIARAFNLSPEYLGVSTTSRTYFNAQQARKELLDFSLGGLRSAVEGRLSMRDTTPRGYRVQTNLSDFMRSDDMTRIQVAAAGKSAGVLTTEEARRYFDPHAPIDVDAAEETPAPAPDPAEENAA